MHDICKTLRRGALLAGLLAGMPTQVGCSDDDDPAGPDPGGGDDGLAVTDEVTGLQWQRMPDTDLDGELDVDDKLTWIQAQIPPDVLNAVGYGGHDDWRLPSVEELQSLVDCTRSPDTTASPAIDPLFQCPAITNERGEVDWGYYWSSTTHLRTGGAGSSAAYVSFGRSLGYMDGAWVDVHGAGSQRSDPKEGDLAQYPEGHGPQGDAIRILNPVRLGRDL